MSHVRLQEGSMCTLQHWSQKHGLYDRIWHEISSSATDTLTFGSVINLPHSLNLLKNIVCTSIWCIKYIKAMILGICLRIEIQQYIPPYITIIGKDVNLNACFWYSLCSNVHEIVIWLYLKFMTCEIMRKNELYTDTYVTLFINKWIRSECIWKHLSLNFPVSYDLFKYFSIIFWCDISIRIYAMFRRTQRAPREGNLNYTSLPRTESKAAYKLYKLFTNYLQTIQKLPTNYAHTVFIMLCDKSWLMKNTYLRQ